MKLAIVLLAILAALMAVSGETKSPSPAAAAGGTATIVGATGATGAAAAGSTVPAIVKAGIPISVGNLTTTSGATTATVQGATTGVTITGTGATGGFVGQPTIVGATGATVSIASPGAAIVGAAGASPAASGAAVISQASPSAAASGAASPAASRAASPAASAVVIVISPSPAASRAASPAASGAASPAASGAASPAASGAASPAASAVVIVISPSPAASGAASPAASGAASPAASGAASPVTVASPAALVSAADFFPPMPTYGQENLQFTCPNATTQAMVEVSLEPLLIGINQVSSIKFAGCPSLMYVATKAGQIFEVTIDNSTSAVTQVRLILDLSNEIASPSTQASTTAGGGTSGGISGGASTMAGGGSTSGGISGGASTTAGGTSGGISGGASASSNAADQPGLLGMAFPPDFADSGLFYVYFSARSSSAAAGGAGGAASATTGGGASSATAGGATIAPSAGGATCGNESTMLNHVNRLAEYRLDRSSGIANFSRTLLELRWPFANGNGDNSLEFAPGSRLLFLGVGDGGSSFDPFENAQNPDVLLGKVHVFDLSSLSPNASCNQTVLRLSELNNRCPDIAAAITTFATGLHSPAGFEFLNPSAALEAASCPGGANATMAGGANATAAGGANATTAGGANATAAGGANATMAGGANATAAGGANATMAGGMNLTLSDLAPRLIAPDRGQGRYDEINIMEEIGANYGWDIIEGWSCIDQSLELCPESTSGMANATLAANRTAGGANATMAGGANATAAGGANATAAGGANATMAGGANATRAGGANLTATSMAVLPAAVIPHNCRRLYDPQAILGGRLYQGSELDPMLQGAYIFGATTSLQNGNESLPTGNGALYFLRPESFVGNAMADLTMCPATVAAGGANATAAGGANATMAGGANATAAGGANATMAGGANATAAGGANATMAGGANATAAGGANATMGGITTTGSGVNTSFIPNSRLEVFPVTINYQFFPTQHFFSAMGADASRSRLFLGVSSTQGATGGLGGVFRLIPFNEGPQNPAIISATNLRPGQIVFSAGGANATMAGGANATASPSPSAAASPSRSG